MVSTKVYKGFQTVVPAKIRKEFNIKEEDVLEWKTNKNEIILTKKEKNELSSIVGIISDEKLDSVEATKKAGMGEKI
ncbi:hypothetical protein MBCUT_08280 [Methanobrevibacter cuticularis]|uniref:SpoVT-AbrB domain-containing protein n=1 Tax=Methanobrevibacter cuticularis TaxID=47311 RepID=A0A166EAA3_9EURY|nr:AbrB/MazE/SpoVT family DNA-binding domain-containing protein [Methanobrevibacter cuticularis]KZX16442.1 hypothetical protein MBCUT_08280 [Methanobrevibacter cuticularis]